MRIIASLTLMLVLSLTAAAQVPKYSINNKKIKSPGKVTFLFKDWPEENIHLQLNGLPASKEKVESYMQVNFVKAKVVDYDAQRHVLYVDYAKSKRAGYLFGAPSFFKPEEYNGPELREYELKAPQFDIHEVNNFRKIVQRGYRIPGILLQNVGSNWDGQLEVRFVLYKDGSIGAAEIVKPIEECSLCSFEALRAFANTEATLSPVQENGKPVDAWVKMPIALKVR